MNSTSNKVWQKSLSCTTKLPKYFFGRRVRGEEKESQFRYFYITSFKKSKSNKSITIYQRYTTVIKFLHRPCSAQHLVPFLHFFCKEIVNCS